MSDSKVQPTPPKMSPTRRNHAARPDGETTQDPENVLASSIGGLNEKFEPYTKPIAVAVVGLVVAAIVWTLYSSEQTGARSDATFRLIQAVESGDPEVLGGVATDYPGTVAAGWAAIFRGDNLLAAGFDDLFRDRDSATEQIEEARSAYRSGLSTQGDRVLVARAYLGLAKIAESEGDIDQAVEAYDEVVANAESDEMRKFAEDRIKFLKVPATASFVGWFGEQDFSPIDPSLPPSLPGMADLPDSSDLDFPKLNLPTGDNSSIDPTSDIGMKLPEEEDVAGDDESAMDTEQAMADAEDSEMDDSEMDDSEMDDSEMDDSEMDDSEMDDSEMDDSEMDDSEMDDSAVEEVSDSDQTDSDLTEADQTEAASSTP